MNHIKRKGFTTVELVIVIAVIAILAAVLIPTFTSLIHKANQSADIQAARQMNMALAMESAIETPKTFPEVIKILADAGYNAEDKLIPISKGHSFYWYKTYNTILLAKDATDEEEATVIYPEDNDDLIENFATDLSESDILFNLKDGAQYFEGAGSEDVGAKLANGESVTLSEDYALETQIEIIGGTVDAPVVLDLNDQALNIAEGCKMAIVSGVVTITGGTINNSSPYDENYNDLGLVVEAGATLNLTDVTVNVYQDGQFGVANHEGGTANITNCAFTVQDLTDGNHPNLLCNEGTMTVTNSSIINDKHDGDWFYAAIVNYKDLTLDNVTVNTLGTGVYTQNEGAVTTVIGGSFVSASGVDFDTRYGGELIQQ